MYKMFNSFSNIILTTIGFVVYISLLVILSTRLIRYSTTLYLLNKFVILSGVLGSIYLGGYFAYKFVYKNQNRLLSFLTVVVTGLIVGVIVLGSSMIIILNSVGS